MLIYRIVFIVMVTVFLLKYVLLKVLDKSIFKTICNKKELSIKLVAENQVSVFYLHST